MRRIAVVLGLAGFAGAALAAVAVPAVAGGPTSVMLVAPESGRAAALHTSNPSSEYELLARLTQPGAGGAVRQIDGRMPDVRLTWLIHDVQVWRVDEVYVGMPGGPWIATRQSGSSDTLSVGPVWHRGSEPARLLQLLVDLKVLDSKKARMTTAPAPVTQDAETQAPESQFPGSQAQDDASTAGESGDGAQAAAPADGSESSGSQAGWVAVSGWRWVVPGLLAGAVLAFLVMWLSPGWQPRDRGPRWELTDETEPANS